MSAELKLRLASARADDAEAAFDVALDALQAGLEEEALPLLRAAVRRHPGDPRLWQLLGLAYRGIEDLAPAVQALRRAAALAPGDAKIAHGLARAALEAGLPALDLFDRARVLAPGDGSVLLGRAAAQLAEGDLAGAIAGLDTVLRTSPLWLEGHATLAGLLWLERGREGLGAGYEAAVRAAPRDVGVWRAFIDTLMRGELYDEALAVLGRARAAAGDHPAFAAAEAVATSEKGDVAAAEPLFDRIRPFAHITMAVRYVRHLLRAGRPAEAAALAESRRGDDPGGLLWPYLSAAWRLTGDGRWQWLDGDPRLVGVYDLTLPDLAALADRLRALHVTMRQPLEQSVRGGTQTDGPLFSRIEPEIRALRGAVVAAVEAHIRQLPPADPEHPLLSAARRRPVRFAGSWSVRLTGGGRHSNHIHPAGWLSSALYVAIPPEGERGPAPAGWLTLGEATELGLDLPPFRMVEPKPGRLVLFPSTMWHGTRAFGAGERLTVAFDVARPRD